MKNITSLLERFSKILDKDSDLKQKISEEISNEIGVSIPAPSFMIKNGVLEISAGAILKNEIKLKEDRIKEALQRNEIFISRILYK